MQELSDPVFRNSMIDVISSMIIKSKDDRSVRQHAEQVLNDFITRTNHHIWLVNQCAGILKDCLIEHGQDAEEFLVNVEYHDYDKLHDAEVIPVYALGSDVFYFAKDKLPYEVDKDHLLKLFKERAFPKHRTTNSHHAAEHFGKFDGETWVVPELNNWLVLGEMVADWMAMGITHGDTARDWWNKTNQKKWKFSSVDTDIIEELLTVEDNANNQLAYLRQFKVVEPSWVPPTEINSDIDTNPLENKASKEAIDSFFEVYKNTEISDKGLLSDIWKGMSDLIINSKVGQSIYALLGKKKDQLSIGPISKDKLNQNLINEFLKKEAECVTLLKWLTVPDYTLLPELEKFGEFIDNLYSFKFPFWVFRGIRTGFTFKHAQQNMGLLDDDRFGNILKSHVKKGYQFDYTPTGPMSVARSPWIARVYGNVISSCKVPQSYKKLVITGELAYVLDHLQRTKYKQFREMNLSCISEIVLFPNQQPLHWEVRTISGDIADCVQLIINDTITPSVEGSISTESLTTKRDDLYIGPIDPMTLDFDKVYELAKHPDLLIALKDWTTTPNHDLMPQLQKLGKIVDELYKFSKPIPCYRGIRTGFSTKPAQNLMGTIDDKLRMFRMLNPEYKAGYQFEFETPEPMSVTRAVFLAKVYGNFIVKCELTKDVNKLVITPELSYLLQQMDIDYPQYRQVNLSVTHECIVFPGQKLTYTVVSTYGDITSELGTMDQSAFESLGYIPIEGSETLSNRSSNEAITAKTPDVKRGKITKAHQDMCGKYLYHGTHRNLDIKFLGIHVCKNRANIDIKAPCVYMNRSLAVACLHCVPFMIGHGSKLANYKEHFVNLEEAINSDGKVVDVEIVHNDPKLQECSGSNDGYIYCVKKEDCVNDLYYATPEEPNNWNFVAYKQLPIDKKIHVTVNWHKKYDEDFAKKVESGYAAIESLNLLDYSDENFFKTGISWTEAQWIGYSSSADYNYQYKKLIKLLDSNKDKLNVPKDFTFKGLLKNEWFVLPTSLTDTETYVETIPCFYSEVSNTKLYSQLKKKYCVDATLEQLHISSSTEYIEFVKSQANRCVDFINQLKKWYIHNSNDKFESLRDRNKFYERCKCAANSAVRQITYLIKTTTQLMSSGLTSNEFYSLEALSDKQEKESRIKIVPIEKDNEEHLKLILEGCNLDSVASGDELWSLQDVKDAIKLGYDAHERPHGGKHFFLLKLKEEFVGMCTLAGNALSGFAIFKQYQGKGYGKQSLKAIIQKMRSGNENKEIVLRVAKKNTKALNLYKSCGFEITDDPYMDKNSYRMILKPETAISTEALSSKEWTENDIKSVDDLKAFYKECSYGLIDFSANKPWKQTHKNTTFEDWEKEWKLLSVQQILQYKCAICYDTAKMNDYFLTKWKIEHINLFAYTKRSMGDDYNDDPTHTFTVYKDIDGKWKWLEGSWGSFKNNNWSESSSDILIKNIGKALANAAKQTNLIGIISKFPADGIGMDDFYHALKKDAMNPKYEVNPDKEYSSTETLDPKIKEKRKYITDYICAICDLMDPSKLNSKRYHRLLDHMSDNEFDQWMHYVKDGKWKLHIVAPNLIINLKNENLLKAADKAKCKLFHRLWMTDNATGRQYLTDNEYLVLTLSVRRQQQYLDEKLSVPDNDRQIDGMTGQVTGDSRACSMTNPEIQILAARGLDATLEELVNVRGGNINAYAEFKRQAEETGEISLNSIDRGSISRVAMVGQILLQSMMIDNNIVGN